MFVLGREKAKDEFDRLLAEGLTFMEARSMMRDRERRRREGLVNDQVEKFAASFVTSSAGVSKAARTESTKGPPLGPPVIKSLSAISLGRLPESRQPLDLVTRPLSETEAVDVAVRHAYVSGVLDLKSCKLTAVPPRAMSTLLIQFGNITSINLNSNLLTTIPAGLAPLCPRLTELAVSNNRLKDVPRSILYLPRVTELNLSFNKIEAVDVLQAPELQVLRINSNYVSSLDNMSYLRKLHTLHMDNCHMSQLTSHMKKLKALTYLDLSHNTLVSLALPSREASESLSGKGKHGTNASDQPTAVVAATAALGDTREWEEVLDPFTGRKSYFCKATKEVRRTKPPGFDLQQAKREQKMRAQRQRQLETAEAMGLRPPEVPSNVTEDLVLRPATASISLISTKLGNAPLWQQCIDEATGHAYFYNTSTGETAWEVPPEEHIALKGWELTVDTTSSEGLVYYTNLATKITQWDMPSEMDTFDALENLTELNVAHNRLTEIAPSVFKLPRLTELNAEHNIIRALPATVNLATSLTKLNLSWNSLESLPKEIYFMHWLKRLTIDNNRLTELGDDVGLLQGLEVFWFGMNQITRLPYAFGKMKSLRDVMFLANPFEFPSMQDIMKGIEHVQWMCRQEGLKYFRGPPPKPKLLHSGIAEEGCMFESEFIKNLTTKLKEAEDTGYLNLNFANMPKIPRDTWEPLWKLTNLRDLRLVDNGFRKLPPKFLLFTSLTNLVLRRNELIELPDHLHLFPSLTGLHVEGNLITSLPPSFAVLTNLTELTLSANRLAELPDCVCRMTKLVRLSVDSNFLERLPSKIGKLTRLKYLCCSRNRITHLPKSIVQLKRLKHLIAYQNRLGDRGIPDCICDMEGLKELQLSYNNISRLPYRFTSGGIMKSLKKLWLYGNCFFDVGDLPLRLASVQDFRIDINPLKSPPAEYTARQIVGLMEYTSLRIARMREIQRRCEAEGWILDPTRFVPVAARDGHVIVGGFGTLNEDELTRFDQFVESYVNGDIYKCKVEAKDVIDDMVEIHRKRWFKYIRKVVLDFQDFIHFVFFNNFISDEYICTDMVRPWGRNGEDVECYGLDLDAFYVNTGFRTAILDVFRGPQRLHLNSVCRFAEPSEFIKRKKSKRWLGLFGKKQASTEGSDHDSDSGSPTSGNDHDYRLAATNPKGNWLWQLATEVVPASNDTTDVLNDELPPVFNRTRNPKCHPDVHASDSSHDTRNPQSHVDAVPGCGVGVDSVLSDGIGTKSDVERRDELSAINARRAKVDLPPLPDPNSQSERNKRLRARRHALPINVQFTFNVSREELEHILREFEGPFGPVAEEDDEYEAYANGEPVPDFIRPEPKDDNAGKKSGRRGRRRKKRAKRLPGEEVDRSDSEEEEERVAAFWEGKHRPCVRKGWVVAKWTMTKKEVKRQDLEEEEVYELVVRMRELVDEHLHTPEGRGRLEREIDRRIDTARAVLEKAEEELAKFQSILLDVRRQQLDMIERGRRFRAGWDFIEHHFRSEHEVEKAQRRAQQEVNDWEAFVATAQSRVARKKARLDMTREKWEMNAVQSMQRVQDEKARDMIVEKNRRIAYKEGWRRPWDGRGGAKFAKWKLRQHMRDMFKAQKEGAEGVSSDSGGDDDEGGHRRRTKADKRKPNISAYDVAGTYSDARTRDFPFAPDTDSEDEQDRAERENLELSSESEFAPSDGGSVHAEDVVSDAGSDEDIGSEHDRGSARDDGSYQAEDDGEEERQ